MIVTSVVAVDRAVSAMQSPVASPDSIVSAMMAISTTLPTGTVAPLAGVKVTSASGDSPRVTRASSQVDGRVAHVRTALSKKSAWAKPAGGVRKSVVDPGRPSPLARTIGASNSAECAAAAKPPAQASSACPSTRMTLPASLALSTPRISATAMAVSKRVGPATRVVVMPMPSISFSTVSEMAAVPPMIIMVSMADRSR